MLISARALVLCATGSLVTHGAFLAITAASSRPVTPPSQVSEGKKRAIEIRALPQSNAQAENGRRTSSESVTEARNDALITQAQPAPAPLPASGVTAPAEGVEASSSTLQDAYLPRKLLTIAPKPMRDIIVPYPGGGGSPGRIATTLSVFIDEEGTTQRVVIDGPAVPLHLENVVKETFLNAKFIPGELNGQRVKSLIRVEVVFETSLLPAPAASAASS